MTVYLKCTFYFPQRSCGKVMFLHLSVILSTGGVCLIACWDTHTPPGQTPPPSRDPHWADTLPSRRLLQRTVRILLKYILVLNLFWTKPPLNGKPMLYVAQPQPHETVPIRIRTISSPSNVGRKTPRRGYNGRSGERQTCYHDTTESKFHKGAPTPKVGHQIYYFTHFGPKIA